MGGARTLALSLVLLAPGLPAAGQGKGAAGDALAPERRELLEQEVLGALSLQREDAGTPPVVWDERLALVLREHLAALVRAGWGPGKPLNTPAGNATSRCRGHHGYELPELFDNYGPKSRAEFSPRAIVLDFWNHPLMKAYPKPEMRTGAAAVLVMEKGDPIVTCIAVVEADPAPVAARAGRAGVAYLAALAAPDPAGRAAALAAHARPAPAESFPWLRRLLASERDVACRKALAEALASIRSPAAVEPLLAALGDGAADVREAAGAGLAALAGPGAAAGRGAAAAKWRAWWTQARDTFTLAPAPADAPPPADPPALAPEDALAGFRKGAREKDPVLRATALRGIAAARPPGASKDVAPLLADPDPVVRGLAAEALGALGEPAAAPALLKAWKAAAAEPRLALPVARALASTPDPVAIAPLSAGLAAGESLAVGRARLAALGRIRDKRAVDALVGLLGEVSGKKELLEPAVAALRALTGEDQGENAAAWREWWKKSKAKFAFPAPPEAPPPVPPPAPGDAGGGERKSG
ncbi:MAG: HEAT repeat domain-containing protein [Planctomycetales bacterium]|nr:HEAT repeat domain-containing protein [Planctomycetales bacterium]